MASTLTMGERLQVFVDHPSYVREGTPYGNEYGAYGDNLFRFSLLSLVACEVPLQLELGGYAYGDKCVFVANDWHASLVCVYVSSKYRPFNGIPSSVLPSPPTSHRRCDSGSDTRPWHTRGAARGSRSDVPTAGLPWWGIPCTGWGASKWRMSAAFPLARHRSVGLR